MNKIVLRVSLILLMVFVFCVSLVHASSDINFDLPGVDNSTPNTETSNNNETSNSDNSQINNNNVDNTTNNDADTDISNPTETEVLQSAGVSSAPETGLSVTNIINILLIAVGVILILLAIAILIRLNG